MATPETYHVNPDAVGDGSGSSPANGYTSLNAANSAKQADISVSTGSDKQITFSCTSSGGGDDTTKVSMTGWTTEAPDNHVIVIGADFPSDGIWDETKYLLHNNDANGEQIDMRVEHIRFVNIQLKVTETAANTRYGFGLYVIAAANDIRIDSCIIKGVCSGTGSAFGVRANDADIVLKVFNTIIYGFAIAADTDFRGFSVDNCTSAGFYNCTIGDNTLGVSRGAGTVTAINCAMFNNENDFNGTITITNCATDEGAGEGTNGVDISGTWDSTCFTDHTTDDYSVKDASSPLYQTGNGATPKGTFTDDIIGTTRDAVDLNWDIGAFELVTAVGAAGIMTTNTGFWGPTF